MAAEEVTRTTLFVNTEWTETTCPATIKLESGEEVALTWGVNAFGSVQTAVDAVSAADINGKYAITLNSGDEVQTLTGSTGVTELWGGSLLVEDFGGRDVIITGDGIIETSNGGNALATGDTFTVVTSNVVIDKGVTYISSGHIVPMGEDGVLDVYGKIDYNTSVSQGPFYLMGTGTINVYDGAEMRYISGNSFSYCGTINVIGNANASDFSEDAQLNLTGNGNGTGVFLLGGNFEGNDGDGVINVKDNGYAYFADNLGLGGNGKASNKGHTGTLNLDKGKVVVGKTLTLGGMSHGGSATQMGAGFVNMTNGSLLEAKAIIVNDAVYGETTTASAFKQDGTSTVIADSITVNGASTYTIDMAGFGGEGTDWSKVYVVLKADAITGNITVKDKPADTAYTYAEKAIGETGKVIYAYDAEKLSTAKLFVTSEELTEGALVEANGTYYVAGATAFEADALQTVFEMASANGADVVTEICIDGTVGDANKTFKIGSENESGTGRHVSFVGEGTINAQHFNYTGGHGSTFDIGEDVTIRIDNPSSESAQFQLTGNTVNVYGKITQGDNVVYSFFRVKAAETKAKLNVKAGSLVDLNQMSVNAGVSYEINVEGNGTAVDKTTGLQFGKWAEQKMLFGGAEITVSDYGYLSFGSKISEIYIGTAKTDNIGVGDSVGFLKLDTGYLDVLSSAVMTIDKGNSFEAVNNSVANIASLTVNGSAKIDATSTLTYTGAITVGEEGSFTVDFTGFEAAGDQLFTLIVDGSASTGGITGNVDVKGMDLEGWKVVQGNSIYAYDASKVDTANVVVNADWADDGLAFGEIAMTDENGVKYLWGITAFGNFSDAIAAGAGNDAITITNANESAYSISGSLDASGFTSLTLGGAWGLANETKVYGDIVLENGASITGASYTYWQDNASVTIVGNASLTEKYLNATEELDVTIVLTGDTNAETSRILCSSAGRFMSPVAVTVTADNVKNLTAETYKIADYNKYNTANYYNYTVDSALKKAGYVLTSNKDGLFLTKGTVYDYSTLVYDNAWAELEAGTEVTYNGKTYVVGYTAFGNINDMAATAVANREFVPEDVTLVINSNYDGGTNTTSFAYSTGINIVCGVDMKETGVVLTSAKVGNSPFDFYCFNEDGKPSHITVGEGVTFQMTGEGQPNLRMQGCIFDIHGTIEYAGTGYSNFYGSFWSTEVTVHETGTLDAAKSYYTFNKLTAIGNGKAYDDEHSQVMVGSLGNTSAAYTTIKDYATYEFLSSDGELKIGKTGTGKMVLENGRVIGAGDGFKGTLQIGESNAGTLEMTGESIIKLSTVNIKANGSADVSFTSTIDYSDKLTVETTEEAAGSLSVNFSDFDATAMDKTFVVIVDGRDAKNGITGAIDYIGDSKLTLAGWIAVNDGKNVYIYDQAVYGKDVYVNSAWSGGNLTEVGEGNYVIGLNAYSSIAAAADAGVTRVISMDALSGDAAYTGLYINFNVAEGVTTVIDGGAVSLDAFNANGKAVEADQLTLNVGGEVVSRADSLVLGDGEGVDAALNFGEGEKLIVNTMFVTEKAEIFGSGLSFSGKGATLTIDEGATLTMSAAQLLNIQGVKIEGADGSIIISDLANLTVSQKEALLAEYGNIIDGLADATVTEDAPVMTDVTDLTQIDPEEFEGEVTGTSAANKLVIKKGDVADYSGIDYNMRGGKNTVTINQGADFAIGDLENVSTIDVKAGSKNDKTVADFGAITAAAGNTTVKVGNNVDFSAEAINKSDLGGTNTVSFGNDVDAEIAYDIYAAKSVTLGKGSTLNMGGDIYNDITTYSNSALKLGNESSISAGNVGMSSVTFGKNVIAELGNLSTVKALSIGANNTVKVDAVDGTAVNGSIKSGNDSTVEIAGDVNMRGGKNSIITGKNSEWTIDGHVMNVNTLTATAAGSWAWNTGKTAYNLQRTRLSISGDFLAGEGAATLTFGNYSIVNIGGSILESDLGSTFKITVGSNAEVAVAENIQSLNSLTIANGVDYKTYSLNEAGKAVADTDKEEGMTKFTAGKVTGTEKNDTIKVGNKAEVKFDKISLGDGNDTINIGKDSYFEAANIELGAGKNTVIVGAESQMNVDDIKSVNKLTVTGELEAGDITGTDDFADVVTFNGVAEVGSIDLGTDAKGKMNDKLVIGKEAEVVINGTISKIETVTIGKDAVVAANEATLADILDFKDVKGSKIDASVEFVALDDAAANAAESTTVYGGNADAWLGIGNDTADCFALGDGVNGDLTDWSISGEGIKVDVYTTTDGTNWKASSVEATDGVFTLGDYTLDGGTTISGIKVAVSLDEDNTDVTKYSITLA